MSRVLKVVSSVLVGVLLVGCAAGEKEFEEENENGIATAAEEAEPEIQIWDLIPSELSREPVTSLSPVTDDPEQLEAALELFKFEERDGEFLDYILRFEPSVRAGLFRAVDLQSEAAKQSDRDRDNVRLRLYHPDVLVWMDGSVTLSFSIRFEKMAGMERRDRAICQGLLFEVGNEAIYINEELQPPPDVDRSQGFRIAEARPSTCELPLERDYESRFFSAGLDGDKDRQDIHRLLRLITEYPFTVKVLDLAGTEHVFVSDEPVEFQAAFEAEKAILNGLGF